MTPIRVLNRTRGTALGDRILLADNVMSRLRGFLFRGEPEAGEGMLLSPCQAVHMIGMRFPLDVILIDEAGTVVAIHEDLRPWQWTPVNRQALHALELPTGTIGRTGTQTGDALSWATADLLPDEQTNGSNPRPPSRSRKLA